MKMSMFSILDGKSGIYNQPFSAVSRGVALRMFTDLVNDPKSNIGRHPEDYTICEIGTYDDNTGLMESHTSPVPLGNAAAFMVRGPEDLIRPNGVKASEVVR